MPSEKKCQRQCFVAMKEGSSKSAPNREIWKNNLMPKIETNFP
jgi:hypothetical protein